MKALTIMLLLGTLAGVSGCATSSRQAAANSPPTVLDAYKPPGYSTYASIRLAVHAQGLSTNQAEALGQFASQWQADQGGVITLRAPDGTANAAAAFRTAEGARALLIQRGVPEDQIVITGYDAGSGADPNLLITYTHYKLDIPACGKIWTSIGNTMSNEPNLNFGCAVQGNMYAQVADPADLDHPHPSAPGDTGRRLTILDLYRKGQVSSSAKDDKATGTLSNAVQ
ncbi:MAG: pilus assembly protein CpaD [Phenylobacterium zucineum]|nr:MAG: pilus assembly protein CpaD [Phenylobacterium zucineum]